MNFWRAIVNFISAEGYKIAFTSEIEEDVRILEIIFGFVASKYILT